ncbi:MAG: Ig-like domain-containing protein [Promethearchaeota archaeon]
MTGMKKAKGSKVKGPLMLALVSLVCFSPILVLPVPLVVNHPGTVAIKNPTGKGVEWTRLKPATFDPNGPQIAVDSPLNESVVTGVDGDVVFLVNVTYQGDAPGATLDKVAQIYVNDTWFDMVDASAGNYSYFRFTSDFSAPSWHGQEVEVKLNVTNSQWVSNTYTLNFTVDNQPPTYTIHAPATEYEYIKTDYTLSVEAQDTLSGIRWVNVTIEQLFGPDQWKDINLTYNPVNSRWEYLWRVVQNRWVMGKYNLTFTFQDNAGVVTRSSRAVIVEYTPPSLSLVGPANGSAISGEVTVTIHTNDPVSNVSEVTLQVGSETPVTLSSSGPQSYAYNFDTVQRQDGWIDITVRSKNDAGLENTTLIRYLIDNAAPVGALSGPFSAVSGNQQFQIACTDASGLGRVAWRIDDKPYHELTTSTLQNFTLPSSYYEDGNHTLTILLEDKANYGCQSGGNTLILSYNITVDNTAPNIAVRNLNYGDSVNTKFVIEIGIYERNPVRLYYSFDEGELVEMTRESENASWYLPVSDFNVTKGTHYLRFVSIDVVGFQDVDEFLIVVTPAQETPWWIWLLAAGAMAGCVVGLYFAWRRIRYARVARKLGAGEYTLPTRDTGASVKEKLNGEQE